MMGRAALFPEGVRAGRGRLGRTLDIAGPGLQREGAVSGTRPKGGTGRGRWRALIAIAAGDGRRATSPVHRHLR